MKRFAITPILLAASAAFGQSVNVDFNASSGAGNGAPANAFKGAAGQSGLWNAVGSSSSVALLNLAGSASGVTLTRSGGGTIVNHSTAALTGDDEKLLEDAFRGSSGVTVTFTFSNLQAGTYALYTYAIDPASSTASIVNVAGSTSRTDQSIGSMLSGPSYFVGATHALHVRTVTAGGSMAVSIAPTGSAVDIAGMQLVQLSTPRLRLHVNDNASGAGNGASWADAFTGLQTALSTARFSGGANTEVWVANGMYEPTTTTERFISFQVPNKLHMYGGFDGDETSVDQRSSNLCYLNGNIGNSGLTSDNSYTVLDASLTDDDTLIDGFRVHNGYNNDNGPGGGKGGGLLLQGSSAVVRDCTFVNNYASIAGAGVYSDQGSATLIDCLFYNNESFDAAGLWHSGDFPILVYGAEFISNSSAEGTVHIDNTDATLANCYFHGNYAAFSGAAMEVQGATAQVTVTSCTLAGNNAGQTTGGIYVRDGADVALSNSILWLNRGTFPIPTTAMQYNVSGAGSTVTVTACTIEGAAGSPGLDPLFIDGDGADNNWGTFDDNCRLQESSPAINLGAMAQVPADWADLDGDGNTGEALPIDFDGLTRVRDTVIDRGAFEYQPACDYSANFDGDDDVDLTDLATLLANFGTASGATHAQGDANGDGAVNLTDLSTCLTQFGSTCP